jgi:phosphate starvation-inducible protein PhoH
VVRHSLVQEIINAYERADKKEEKKQPQFTGKYKRKTDHG